MTRLIGCARVSTRQQTAFSTPASDPMTCVGHGGIPGVNGPYTRRPDRSLGSV